MSNSTKKGSLDQRRDPLSTGNALTKEKAGQVSRNRSKVKGSLLSQSDGTHFSSPLLSSATQFYTMPFLLTGFLYTVFYADCNLIVKLIGIGIGI